MTDKEKIKAEIERLLHSPSYPYSLGAFNALQDILSYINSLPEEPVSEDEKTRKWIRKELESKYVVDNIVNNKMADKAFAWLEKQGKNNMGISESTKQKLEDNLNKALEKETPESWNEFLEKQREQKPVPKYEIGDTIYYNSFGKIESMVVANIVDTGDGNPMYEDSEGDAVFEKDLILQMHVEVQKPGV